MAAWAHSEGRQDDLIEEDASLSLHAGDTFLSNAVGDPGWMASSDNVGDHNTIDGVMISGRALAATNEEIEKGIAWSIIIFTAGYMAVGVVALGLLIRERNVFEIRARSAYLLILSGFCLFAMMTIIVQTHLTLVLGYDNNYYITTTLYFFAVACLIPCYGSRVLRLFVMYSPRARRMMPWLMPEWHHVVAALLIGLSALSFPLYTMANVDGEPNAELLFVMGASKQLHNMTIGCQCAIFAFFPLLWKVDDIFRIGTELRIMLVSQVLVNVIGRLGNEYANPSIEVWINTGNAGFLGVVIMFGISLLNPIRQLIMDPLETSDPQISRALASRKRAGIGIAHSSTSSTPSWIDEGSSASTRIASSSGRVAGVGGASNSASDGSFTWTFETVMSCPMLSSAFEEFSRKALCQESVLFLKAVHEFQGGMHRGEEKGGESSGSTSTSNIDSGNEDERSASSRDPHYYDFNAIIRKYILDGSPDEVNISGTVKKSILEVYNAGFPTFRKLSLKDRRFIFARAYADVRYMLEANLMSRFVDTHGLDSGPSIDSSAARA